METGREIAKLLKVQVGHYRSMKQAVEKQTAYIDAMDVGGLTAGACEVRGLMRKIRDLDAGLRPLRQSWSTLGIDRPAPERREIEALIASIRMLITEIQEVKNQNTSLLTRSMERFRKQMAGLNTQSRAARAYHRRPAQAARFVDRSN